MSFWGFVRGSKVKYDFTGLNNLPICAKQGSVFKNLGELKPIDMFINYAEIAFDGEIVAVTTNLRYASISAPHGNYLVK